jgi:hypothetical protein
MEFEFYIQLNVVSGDTNETTGAISINPVYILCLNFSHTIFYVLVAWVFAGGSFIAE